MTSSLTSLGAITAIHGDDHFLGRHLRICVYYTGGPVSLRNYDLGK